MSTSNEDIRDSVKRMAHTLQKIEAVCIDALMTRPYKPDEARQHFSEALAEIRKLCPEPFGNVADVKVLPIPNANDQLGTGNIGNSSPFPLPPSPKDWLEMPRGIKLQRFSNTKRETHFVGQYRDMNPISGNPTPRRVYTIDVMPMIDDSECKEFEVWVSAKHLGEQFHPSQKGAPERIMVDRMLLVEPEKK